jgi:hypothetical protein
VATNSVLRCGATRAAAWQHAIYMRELSKFFRSNPQVLILLIICIVLGLGTFLAVVFGLVTSGSTATTGEPEGSIAILHDILG